MSFKFREPKDFSSMYHDCTGPGCTFCSWRAEHPIRLNWESLFDEPDDRIVGGIQVTSSQMGDPYKALSTQQTDEYLNQFEENLLDFPPISDDLLIPGRSSSKRGPGIDCLRMRHIIPRNWGLRISSYNAQ